VSELVGFAEQLLKALLYVVAEAIDHVPLPLLVL
jgi:hypothetical protein